MGKFVRKNKFLVVVVCLFVLFTSMYATVVFVASRDYNGITIVLDAGHGGLDVK